MERRPSLTLAQLKKKVDEAYEKYGDKPVVIDVDGRAYPFCYTDVRGAGMALCDKDYEEDPSLLEDGAGGLNYFILHPTLENSQILWRAEK
jgi:hypothetical protein